MFKISKAVVFSGLLFIGVAGNVYYHWEQIWTAWAKYYIRDQDIVISLTTIPSRINELETTLQCLERQIAPIRAIFVNIPYVFKRDNTQYQIPEWLEYDPNITILRGDDYGPATKILGTLKNAPLTKDTIVISIDDDTCYPSNMALHLAVRAKMNPNEAIGVSGAILDFEKNKEGGVVKIMRDKAIVPVLEGFAGIAYKPKFFDDSIYEIANEPSFCSNSDDLYISFHLARQNITRRVVQHVYLNTYQVNQLQFGYKPDALYRLGTSQADRYKQCLDYLTNKFPEVEFSANGIN